MTRRIGNRYIRETRGGGGGSKIAGLNFVSRCRILGRDGSKRVERIDRVWDFTNAQWHTVSKLSQSKESASGLTFHVHGRAVGDVVNINQGKGLESGLANATIFQGKPRRDTAKIWTGVPRHAGNMERQTDHFIRLLAWPLMLDSVLQVIYHEDMMRVRDRKRVDMCVGQASHSPTSRVVYSEVIYGLFSSSRVRGCHQFT